MTEPSIVAQGYDAIYEAMPRSPTLLKLWKQHAAGNDYPDDFYHISFVTLGALQLTPGSTFADIACGMGGPALWIANETGAHLRGVDFSRVAIAQAEKRAAALGLADVAAFYVGAFDNTGLDSGSLDAAMSIDALQYAPSKLDAIEEFARILRHNGRLAFFAFELDPSRTEGLPVLGDDPVADYRPLLEANGFEVLTYTQTHRWRERLQAVYGAVIAEATLKEEMGPLPTAALMSEMTLTLERDFYSGRAFVVAERKP